MTTKAHRCADCEKHFVTYLSVEDFSRHHEDVVMEFLMRRPTSTFCNDCLFQKIIDELKLL